MEAIDTRVKKGIRVYLERRGFEILGEGWAHGGDVADFIVRDEDDLVSVHCQITQNGGEGFPERTRITWRSNGPRLPTSPSTWTPRTSGSGSTS